MTIGLRDLGRHPEDLSLRSDRAGPEGYATSRFGQETHLVRNRLDFRGVKKDLELRHPEVADADAPEGQGSVRCDCGRSRARANGLYEAVLLQLLHLRPCRGDVRRGETRVVDEVQVHIIDA